MTETELITVKRIRGGSIIKVILIGSVIGCAIVTTVFGFFALFGAEVVKWNDQYITGIKGFIASPFIGLFIGGVFGLFTSFFVYIGLRIYALFNDISIEYIPSNQSINTDPQ